jgi:hypothetical protein
MTNYPGGVEAFVEEAQRHVDAGLVREGLAKIREKFASPEREPWFLSQSWNED